MNLHRLLPLVLPLLLASCVSFGGNGGVLGSTEFSLHFRDSSSFPDLEPFNNVLLVDVSNNVDWLNLAPSLQEKIDGTLVHAQPVTQGGRIELPFPPAEWTRASGDHEVEVTIGDVTHSLPFTWHGS